MAVLNSSLALACLIAAFSVPHREPAALCAKKWSMRNAHAYSNWCLCDTEGAEKG